MTTIHYEQYKYKDGVLGTRTRGGWMEGADEFTELWRHPNISKVTNLDGFTWSDLGILASLSFGREGLYNCERLQKPFSSFLTVMEESNCVYHWCINDMVH